MTLPSQRLLHALENHFPLHSRPFAALARNLGCSEPEVLEAVRDLCGRRVVRRIGATFDPRRLGYVTTLVGLQVAAPQVATLAATVGAYREVTHCYEREHRWNVWFTLIVPDQRRIDEILEVVAALPGVLRCQEFPATRIFKIDARFAREVPHDH